MTDSVRFEIRFESVGDGVVACVDAPDGPVRAPFEWEWASGDDPRLFSGRWSTPREGGARPPLARYGERLHAALFDGPLGDRFAAVRSRPVELVLSFPPGDAALGAVAALPWELLRADGAYLCLHEGFTLTRQWRVVAGDRPPPVGALNVLVVPSPTGATLDLEREVAHIRAELGHRTDTTVRVLARPTLGLLWAALSGEEIHVVHFAGHGQYSRGRGGALWMQDDAGREMALAAEDLAPHLARLGTRLVVLAACSSGAHESAYAGGFDDVATTLVRRGVPAVVGMAAPVSDGAAVAFTQGFYRALSRGATVGEATGEGRRAIHAQGHDWSEWGIPLLLSGPHPVRLALPFAPDPHAAPLLDAWLEWLGAREGRLHLPMVEGHLPAAVALDSVFVALRGAAAVATEWEAARQELLDRVTERMERLAADAPAQFDRVLHGWIAGVSVDPLLGERPASPTRVSIARAFRAEPCLVVLGHPGTGKTTLARWLVVRLAEGWRRGEAEIRVPARSVDPEAAPDAPDESLGRPRIPLFLSVSAYAASWSGDRDVPVEEHIRQRAAAFALETGRSPADGERLGARLLAAVQAGEAAVVLDGLDEIAQPALRPRVVAEVDRFLARAVRSDTPRDRGNRVVVTSRVVGYAYTPLAQAVHYTLEPMGPVAIARLAERWLSAGAGGAADPAELRSFLQQVKTLERVGAGELATTPLSLSILLIVFRAGRGELPRQRTALYRKAVEALLARWRGRRGALDPGGDGGDRVLPLLAALATHMHDRAGASLIGRDELRGFLRDRVRPEEIDPFLRLLEADVGLLTARGEGVYGFLHLTFQEYLAGVDLASQPAPVPILLRRLDAPRWCEPLLLALGELGHRLHRDEDLRVLAERLLGHPDPLRGMLPRASLLLAAAVPELPRVPASLVELVLDDLLAHRANRALLDRFPEVLGWIEGAFRGLLRADVAPVTWRLLRRALKPGAPPERLLAAACLVAVGPPAPEFIGELLLAAEPRDDADWGWPVDRALRHLAGMESLVLPEGSLRDVLRRDPTLRARYLADPTWVGIGVALFGAVDHAAAEAWRAAAAELRALDAEVEAQIRRGEHEEAARTATRRPALEERAKPPPPRSAEELLPRMSRDSPALTRVLVDALRSEAPPASIAGKLEALAAAGDADAALARALLPGPHEPPASVAGRLARAVDAVLPTLAGAVQQSFDRPARWMAEAGAGEEGVAYADAMQRLAIRWIGRPARVQPPWPSTPLGTALAADFLLHVVDLPSDDRVYNVAVTLDTAGGALAPSPTFLREVLARVPERAAARAPTARWPVAPLAGPATTSAERLARALAVLDVLPPELRFVESWAIAVLAPLLRQEGMVGAALGMIDRHAARAPTGDWEGARRALAGDAADPPELDLTRAFGAPPDTRDDAPLTKLAARLWMVEARLDKSPAPTVLTSVAAPLRAQDRAGAARALKRHLQPHPALVAVLRAHRGDDALGALCELLLAQIDGVHSGNLDRLHVLAGSGDALIRARAWLTLEREADLPASTVGTDALRAVAARMWAAETSPGHALTGVWLLERVVLDDPELARAWVAAMDGDADLRAVLQGLGAVTEGCWPALLAGLETGGPRTRRAILRLMLFLAGRSRLPSALPGLLAPLLARLPTDGWGDEPWVVDEPAQVVALAEEAVARGGADAPRWLASTLRERRRRLAELASLPPDVLASRMSELGRERLASTGVRQATRAGERIGERPDLFPALVAWLAAELVEWSPGPGGVEPSPVASLVEGLAVAGARAPHLLVRAARAHPGLERGLVAVARTADSFVTRAAALRLLSHLGALTPLVAAAIRASVVDVAPVQRAALESITRYTRVAERVFDPAADDPDVLDEVLEALTGGTAPDAPEGVYLVSEALCAFARAATTPPPVRDRVVGWLRAHIEGPLASEEVWFLHAGDDAKDLRLHALGRLDRLLFAHLAALTGVSELHRRLPLEPP